MVFRFIILKNIFPKPLLILTKYRKLNISLKSFPNNHVIFITTSQWKNDKHFNSRHYMKFLQMAYQDLFLTE